MRRRTAAATAAIAATALLAAALQLAQPAAAVPSVQVVDMFGRTVNDYGVKLVDWQGYVANPYVELTVVPAANSAFPVTVDLAAEGTSRLMMDLPSQLTANGATKRLTFSSASDRKTFKLEIESKHQPGDDERYTLRLTTRAADSTTLVQTMPIMVQQDEKTALEPTIPITFDYRYDTITHYFDDPAFRTAAEEAVKDWYRFFDVAPFDTVAAGAESNHLPGNDWQNTVNVTNASAYNGMYVFFRGIQSPYSTGFPAGNGRYSTRNGVQLPGPLHRSTAMIFEYDEAGHQLFTSLADEDWWKTNITGSVLDVHGLVMHEYGHAVAYNSLWAGMRDYVATNGANDSEVIDYQGHAVALDSSYHIPGDQPNWDRISGQSGGWTHLFPTRRWMLTKLALLIAENAGWPLNKNLTPFLKPSITSTGVANASAGQAYSQTLTARGGVPFYDWRVTSGSLPAGLTLDRFTGTISGTPTTNGTSTFTVELRDYDARSTPVTKQFTLTVGAGSGTTTTTTTTSTTTTTRPTTTTTTSITRPTTTTTRPVTSTTTTTGGSGGTGCSATYSLVGSWPGGFQGEVAVTAGPAPISGWKVTWTYASGQTVTQAWGATVSSSGSAVTATNVAYNGSLAAGARTTFGFLGNAGGANSVPGVTCTAS